MRTAVTILALAALTAESSRPATQEAKKPVNRATGEETREQHGARPVRSPNHLEGQTSPYLLQHVYNPVDWYPWGPEAIAKARKEKKPIFLSIGYSACHWCHVMERESFENEEIAKILNAHFVSIKVDREERPDVDEVYMAAVVAMTRSGGWPLSVFLTPELEPFWGGTYFPPDEKFGRPGFKQVLEAMRKVWADDRERATTHAKKLIDSIAAEARERKVGEFDAKATFENAVRLSGLRFDPEHGGFGEAPVFAPKFPHCTELAFLLRHAKRAKNARALQVVETTLERMARGGIYDQIAGGFHRYSVDREWLVPHFEKMLYDNAQLAVLYLEAYQATGKSLYRRVATEVLDYVLREMTSSEGGFFSTTDADSEGEEGKFFVWSKKEIGEHLGADAELACEFFGVTGAGNFEGHNILTRRASVAAFAKTKGKKVEELEALVDAWRKSLLAARKRRVAPGLDDKILSSWNGLMCSAFARAAQVLGRDDYLQASRRNADFLLTKMRAPSDDGLRLLRTRREGVSHLDAYLEDYAYVGAALIDVYEADPDARWIGAALEIQREVEKRFAGPKGGYYSTAAADGEDTMKLPLRMASAQESSLPSEAGVAGMNAARLGLLAGDTKLLDRARGLLALHAAELDRWPNAFGQLLLLADFLDAGPREVYVAGERGAIATQAFLKGLRAQYPPYRVLALVEPGEASELAKLLPAARGKEPVDGKPAAWVCYEGVCKAPTTDPSQLDG